MSMKLHRTAPAERSTLDTLKLFADDTRWQLINELRTSDRQAGELVERLQRSVNPVSVDSLVVYQHGAV
jgi:hypothetical protein